MLACGSALRRNFRSLSIEVPEPQTLLTHVVLVYPEIPARRPQDQRRGPAQGQQRRHHLPRDRAGGGRVHQEGARTRRRGRGGGRRRQHLARRGGEPARTGPDDGRLHGDAGHHHERHRAPEPVGVHRHRDARADRHRGQERGGALRRPPRRAPPGKAARGHLRGRDGQPFLFHRHDGGVAGQRDRSADHPQGDQGGRHLHGRPDEGPDRPALRPHLLPGSPGQAAPGDGFRRVQPLHGTTACPSSS